MNLDFDLTEEQVQTREMVRKFAQKEIAPHVLDYNREERLPMEIVEKMKEMELIGGVIPPEYGGAGIDHVSWVITIEEISRICSSLAVVVGGPSSLVGQGILKFGTEDALRVGKTVRGAGKVALLQLRLREDFSVGRQRLLLRGERLVGGLDDAFAQGPLLKRGSVEEDTELPDGLGLAAQSCAEGGDGGVDVGVVKRCEVGCQRDQVGREADEFVAGQACGGSKDAERLCGLEGVLPGLAEGL